MANIITKGLIGDLISVGSSCRFNNRIKHICRELFDNLDVMLSSVTYDQAELNLNVNSKPIRTATITADCTHIGYVKVVIQTNQKTTIHHCGRYYTMSQFKAKCELELQRVRDFQESL